MRRGTLITIIALVILAVQVSPIGRPGGTATAQSGQPRLVVFELFGSTCESCVSAGSAADTLAERFEQAKLPVLFIEYSSSVPLGNRLDRWYDACPDWRGCYLPLELVDSGWRWSCGPKDFLAVYTDLVDQAMANPAGADLVARYQRSGNDLDVSLQVTNRSGGDLGPGNRATVNVIVYEHARVLNSGRIARAAADVPLVAVLPDGHQETFRVQLANVQVGDWDRAVVVALLDHRPDPTSVHYASLQAAIASEGLPPSPTPMPSPTLPPTPASPMTPTATPVWTGRPLFLPLAAQLARPVTRAR